MAESDPDMSTAILMRVDPSGLGDFKKIQDAIDAVPSNNSDLIFIWIKPGVYQEKIIVPADKPYVTLSGSDAFKTIITWNDTGEIYDSPTMAVLASSFVGRYLTIQVYIFFLFFSFYVSFFESKKSKLTWMMHAEFVWKDW